MFVLILNKNELYPNRYANIMNHKTIPYISKEIVWPPLWIQSYQ